MTHVITPKEQFKTFTEAVERYRETIGSIFDFTVAEPDFQRDLAVSLLCRRSTLELYGPPGGGKSSLADAISIAFTGRRMAKVNCTEGIRPSDWCYTNVIGQRGTNADGKTDQQVYYDVKPRAGMDDHFWFFDEANRINKETNNVLMPLLAEWEYTIKGVTLKKKHGIVILAYNPYYGEFDPALNDRILCSLSMGELDMYQQHCLIKRKFGGKTITDPIDVVKQKLQPEELEEIWDMVDQVEFDDEKYVHALLCVNAFKACKEADLGNVTEEYLQTIHNKCDTCSFNAGCLTKQLQRPILTRGLIDFIRVCKAHAFWNARTEIDLTKDALPALKLVMSHRAKLKSEYSAKHANNLEWFDKEVFKFMDSTSKPWHKAKQTYQDIAGMVNGGDAVGANQLYGKFVSTTKDVGAWSMMQDMGSKLVKGAQRQEAQKVITLLEEYDNGAQPFTSKELDEVEKRVEYLPKDLKEGVLFSLKKIQNFMECEQMFSKVTWKVIFAKLGQALGTGFDDNNLEYSHEYQCEDGTKINWKVEDRITLNMKLQSSQLYQLAKEIMG